MKSLWLRNTALALIAILLSYVFLQLPEQKSARQQCLEWKEEMQTRGIIGDPPGCR
jgi:hypothetical protein